jgi:hypothetical protein
MLIELIGKVGAVQPVELSVSRFLVNCDRSH